MDYHHKRALVCIDHYCLDHSYEYICDHIHNHHMDGQHKRNLGQYPNLNHYIDHNHENQRDYIHHYHNRLPSKIST